MGKVVSGRVARLFDDGVFQELFPHPASVYLCAHGRSGGRPLVVIASDPEPPAQAPDLARSLKRVLSSLAEARARRCPVAILFDAPAMYQSRKTAFQGTGQELLASREGVGRFYYELGSLARQVPVVGAVLGVMAQAQSFPVAMCRALVMLKDSALCIARPDAVKAMLGEDTDYQSLGGAGLHYHQTGICDHVADNDEEALQWLRCVLRYLPENKDQSPPLAAARGNDPAAPPLAEVIPQRLDKPFKAGAVIEALADQSSFLELGAGHAREMVTGLGRVGGIPCALVVSNPQVKGGLLFPETCRKLTRFLGFAGDFNLPLITLADAPGFMIGQKVERDGAVEAGAGLFQALAQYGPPRLCVILRRAYTAGLYGVGGAGFQPGGLWALPGASISVYGEEAVTRFLKNLDLVPAEEDKLRHRMEHEHSLSHMLECGWLDRVVPPEKLRSRIAEFLTENGYGAD